MRETKKLEYKENIDTNSFLKTISAFANYSDGEIIFGIRDNGTIKGIDNPIHACLSLENKINNSIKPIIENIFFRLNYIEMFGSSIKRINASYKDFSNKPEFKIYENSITVILPVKSTLTSLNEDEKTILSVLNNNLKLSRTQIENSTHFSKNKTIRTLNSLIEKNVIQKIETARNTKYILK